MANERDDTRNVPLESPGEKTLPMHDEPPQPEKPRQIHQRRPLPLVPDAPGTSSDDIGERDSS